MWLGHSQRTSSLSSDKKKSVKKVTPTRRSGVTTKTVNHEIVYKLDGVTSWIYFYAEPGKAKVTGEKKFKRFISDSGWTKRAKLVRIKKITKAIDPPEQKSRRKT